VAIRFDSGTIRSPIKTPEGYFKAVGSFAKQGILEYRTPDGGVRREFRPGEENEKALKKWASQIVTNEHPDRLVNAENAKQYQVGITDSTVFLEDDYVRGVVIVTDAEAVRSIERGDTTEISTGYKCRVINEPGTWRGQHYDAIQVDIEPNHVALTKKGRAGSDVALHLDSDDKDVAYQTTNKHKSMASLTIKGATYEVDPLIASVVSGHISDLEKQAIKADSLSEKEIELDKQIAALQQQIEELTEERDRYQGHADAYEVVTTNALPILEKHGYAWNADSEEFVLDSKKKKMMVEEDDEEEDEEEEYEDEEEMMPKSKKKKMDMKKYDSSDKDDEEDDEEEGDEDDEEYGDEEEMTARKDSVPVILEAWKKAEDLGLNFKFDSALGRDDIYHAIASELMPDVDLSNASSAYLEGVIDRLLIESQSDDDSDDFGRTDSADSDIYSTNLRQMIGLTRSGENPAQKQAERSQELANAWQQPLSLSKNS
jgi:hypothetical protein